MLFKQQSGLHSDHYAARFLLYTRWCVGLQFELSELSGRKLVERCILLASFSLALPEFAAQDLARSIFGNRIDDLDKMNAFITS
jgi:hypothetical protein